MYFVISVILALNIAIPAALMWSMVALIASFIGVFLSHETWLNKSFSAWEIIWILMYPVFMYCFTWIVSYVVAMFLMGGFYRFGDDNAQLTSVFLACLISTCVFLWVV